MATDTIARGMAEGVVSQVSADKQAVSEDRNAVEAAKTEVLNVAESIPEDYSTLSADVSELKEDLSALDECLDVEIINPINLININDLTIGRILYNGNIDTSENYRTTNYISVKTGDVLRLYKGAEYEGTIKLERITGERIALYDINKEYIGVSGQFPFTLNNGYTVTDELAKYIRVTFGANNNNVELTANRMEIDYTEYREPYKDYNRIVSIENRYRKTIKVIDCWGDSRTDMNDDGTSFCDYLQTLLGTSYIVSNRGISGQASGQVACRYGSNEVYLTLTNNQINGSGATLITSWNTSTGTNLNLRGGDSVYGVHGMLNGVSGKYIHTTGGNINFVRDYAGETVKVKPRTKFIPDSYFNANHIQILWCGKNDFSYAAPNVVSGVIGNYDGMTAKIPHEKFIILGETNSTTDSYKEGTTGRKNVDSINSYLSEKYPNNFIDIQAELISKGLTLENIDATSDDIEYIGFGFIPKSLMYDTVHMNEHGRSAVAKIIYSFMQDRGWI